MMNMRKVSAGLGAAALVMSAACGQDLNVTNPNNPDVARALSSPADVQSVAVSSFNSWFQAANHIYPYTMLTVTADALTANFGNFGMRFNNVEPRIQYHNIASDGDAPVANTSWKNFYGALGQANDALSAVAGGVQLPGGTAQYKTLAQFSQAGALMQLGLVFDKAFVVDETFDPTKALPALVPYDSVIKVAMSKFDAVIAASAGQSWTYDASVFPSANGTLTASRLNRLANTLAALTLTYEPRNAADAAKVDWARVLKYADKGIGTGSAGAPFDFVVIGDGGTNWYNYLMYYADDPTWMRPDQHLIHQMNASVPDKFDGTVVAPTGPGDARLGPGKDYQFDGDLIGDATRGIYMQSPFSHRRYYDVAEDSPTSLVGPMPYLLAAESDLAKAEALVRTNGDLALAAQLINNTRVTRGALAPMTASSGTAALLAAITYEREVETMATSAFTFFQLRHDDALQAGTLRHLPVPAAELENDGLPIYTFGGVGLPTQNTAPMTPIRLSVDILGSASKTMELPSGRLLTLHMKTPHPRPTKGPFKF
jgi:hypothetical protein